MCSYLSQSCKNEIVSFMTNDSWSESKHLQASYLILMLYSNEWKIFIASGNYNLAFLNSTIRNSYLPSGMTAVNEVSFLLLEYYNSSYAMEITNALCLEPFSKT